MKLNIKSRKYGDEPVGEFQLTVTVPAPMRERSVGIEVSLGTHFVNMCSSGPVTPEGARELAKALLYAADLADGTITIE
jgi:hypothetical protein